MDRKHRRLASGKARAAGQTLAKAAFEFELERLIDAPRERVFAAWAKPEAVAEWFAPKPLALIVEEMDFRPGGGFRMARRGPDGRDFPFTGRYREIVAPRRLSWSGEFPSGPADSISTAVTFEEQGRKTKVRVHQAFHAMTSELKPAAKGARQGWTKTLEQLAAFCSGAMNERMQRRIEVRARIEDYIARRNESRRQKIAPCLWFNDRAEEAAQFYVSIFKNAKILGMARYGEAGAKASGRPRGSVMSVSFQLEGQEFLALNAGPQFTFSPAISLMVNCATQPEIDELWSRLSAHPKAEQCGWLKDKFGVSWQIVPAALSQMMRDSDVRKSERVMAALVRMKKLDLGALQAAAAWDWDACKLGP